MKKKLAVLCGVYYPEPSPTGLCVKKFVDLLQDDFDIDILCIAKNGVAETVCREDGAVIHTLTCRRLEKEMRATGMKRKVLHLFGAAQIKLRLLGNLSWLRKAYTEKLCELSAKQPYDAVFSVCSPFAAHVAAKDYRASHPSVHWCAYTVDPYAAKNRIRPVGVSFRRLCAAERETLCKADSLLLSEEVFCHRKDLYAGHPDCQPLPYILPATGCVGGERAYFDKDDINCVYAGRFYEDIRNPETMLKVFSSLEDSKIKLHLFSVGCEEIVCRYQQQCPNILVHDPVPHDEIAKVYRDADILVNVTNTVEEFLPSKTFEYIALCKPIVDFCAAAENRELARYPLCLQIRHGNGEDAAAVREFVTKSRGKTVSDMQITEIYRKNTKACVKEILRKAILREAF